LSLPSSETLSMVNEVGTGDELVMVISFVAVSPMSSSLKSMTS
jgi:hypothetical protein